MFSFNLLGMFFPDRMLLGAEISLVGTPIIGIKTRHTKWRQSCFSLRTRYLYAFPIHKLG